MSYSSPGITFDEARFDPMRITEVRHTLMEHPLLQLPSLIELGKRLDAAGSVRSHNASAQPSTNFATAPETHPATLSTEETIRRIEEAKSWLSLLHIQRDPLYRTLVDEVLDHLQPRIEARDPGMHHRAGWIFITSPGAVTPFHFDHEHNFILQILGKKRVYVWDPLDTQVVTEDALETFHGRLSRDRLLWRDDHLARANAFDFLPGLGAYMPQTAPHLVENGDGVSITLSVTYYTHATRRRQELHRANHLLRRMGLAPSPVNRVAPAEPVKGLAFRSLRAGRKAMARVKGQTVLNLGEKHAELELCKGVY